MFDYELARVEKKIRRMFDRGVFSDRRIYVFGVSENTRQIIQILRSYGLEPLKVLDNDKKKQNSYCSGVQVIPVEQIRNMQNVRNLYIMYSYYWQEMAAQLRDHYVRKESILNLFQDEFLWKRLYHAVRGKRIYDNLIGRYGNVPIFLCPYTGTGDIYLIGTFWNQYVERNHIEDYVFLVISKACEKAAMLFEIKNIEVLDRKIESDYLIQYYKLCPEQVNMKILNDSWPQIHTNPLEWFRGYKGLKFMPLFRKFVFDLPDRVKPEHPVFQNVDDELEAAFKEHCLQPGNTVILSPYSNTLADLPKSFWGRLAEGLKRAGFTVCTNSSKETEPAVRGTVPVFFSLNTAPQWVEKAGYFVGVRSGFCDIVSGAKAKKVILYDLHDRFFNGSSYEYFNLKDMELCENAVEIPFDKPNRQLCEKVLQTVIEQTP